MSIKSMKKNIFVVLNMGLFFLLCHRLEAQTIYLSLGQNHQLPAQNVQKVRVEKGKVLGVKQQGAFLNVRARAPGQSKLYIDGTQHQFIVLSGATLSGFKKLKQYVRQKPGLSVKIQGQQAYVQGQLQNFKHWQGLAQLNVPYHFRAQIKKNIQTQVRLFFSELVRSHSLPMPLFNWQPWPHAQVGGPSLLPVKNLRHVLQAYGIKVEHEPEALFVEPTVRLQVVLAEINKKWSRRWGLDWGENTVAQVLQNPSSLSLTRLLQVMESTGQGEVLAQPTLVCRNKGEAQFLAGGEFGIKLQSTSKIRVVWKPHGVILKLKPQLGLQKRMKLDVAVEVSMIDHSQQIMDGVPALKTNRFSSQFDLLQSQTIYLSGLLQNVQGLSSQGLAYLTRIPILGALFGSHEFTRNNTSLVVFVTPQAVQN